MLPPSAERLYRTACREAWIVLLVWLLALLWTLGYCYLYGYTHTADSWVVRAGLAPPSHPGGSPHSADELQLCLGFPHWVFFGILVPWVLCSLFTLGFCLWGMSDGDLGQDREEGGEHAP